MLQPVQFHFGMNLGLIFNHWVSETPQEPIHKDQLLPGGVEQVMVHAAVQHAFDRSTLPVSVTLETDLRDRTGVADMTSVGDLQPVGPSAVEQGVIGRKEGVKPPLLHFHRRLFGHPPAKEGDHFKELGPSLWRHRFDVKRIVPTGISVLPTRPTVLVISTGRGQDSRDAWGRDNFLQDRRVCGRTNFHQVGALRTCVQGHPPRQE